MGTEKPPYSTETDRSTTWTTPMSQGHDASQQADTLGKSAAKVGRERSGVGVRDAVDKTREKMAAYRQGGVEEVSRDVLAYTRNQPLIALLIATGLGLVAGILAGSGRR